MVVLGRKAGVWVLSAYHLVVTTVRVLFCLVLSYCVVGCGMAVVCDGVWLCEHARYPRTPLRLSCCLLVFFLFFLFFSPPPFFTIRLSFVGMAVGVTMCWCVVLA